MIGVFIPSYNRACQLHTLLESITLHDKNNLFSNIHVYYQGSTDNFAKAYDNLVLESYFKNICFHAKTTFGLAYDMLEVMEKSKYEYFCVITDDCIFYRNFDLTQKEFDNLLSTEVNHFTLRCGRNTTSGDYTRPHIKCKVQAEDLINCPSTPSIIKWHWPSHDDCYGYPNALDGTIFNREYILKCTLNAVQRTFDYRRWECLVHEYMRHHQEKQYALSFEQSVLVNSPNNMVADGPYCRNGEIYKFTVEELNNKYLSNQKIDISKIHPNSIISVQQELPLEFIKNAH